MTEHKTTDCTYVGSARSAGRHAYRSMHCQFGNSLGTGVSENGLAEKERKRRRGSRLFDLSVLAVSSVSGLAPLRSKTGTGFDKHLLCQFYLHDSLSSSSTKKNLAQYLMKPFVEFDACIPQIIILPWRTHGGGESAQSDGGISRKNAICALSHPSSSSSPHRRRRSIDFSIARKEEQCAFFPPPLDSPPPSPFSPKGVLGAFLILFSSVFSEACA